MKAVLRGAGLPLLLLGDLACKGVDPAQAKKDMRPPDLRAVPDLTVLDLTPPPDLMLPPDLLPPTLAPPGCVDDSTATATQVYNLVFATCTGRICHVGPGIMGGGLSLGENVMELKMNVINRMATTAAMPYVTPGDIDKSYLLYKMTGQQANIPGGGGVKMPRNVFMSDEQVCVFINWVKFGAS